MRIALTMTACLLLSPSLSPAQQNDQTQGNNAPPTTMGKVVEVAEKGRLKVLHVTDADGNALEFNITPLVKLEVHGTGDEGFVRAGQYVTSTGTLTNNQLFVDQINVYMYPKGKRPPVGRVVKSPRRVGTSQNSYDISGVVLAKQQSPDYPEYEMLALQVAGKPPVIMLNKNYKVNVISLDPGAAPEGADIEMLLKELRGGKKTLVAAKVTISEPLKSDEILGPLEGSAE